jgi:hypothetical protein
VSDEQPTDDEVSELMQGLRYDVPDLKPRELTIGQLEELRDKLGKIRKWIKRRLNNSEFIRLSSDEGELGRLDAEARHISRLYDENRMDDGLREHLRQLGIKRNEMHERISKRKRENDE